MLLGQKETYKLLRSYKIRTPNTEIHGKNVSSTKLRFPLALKVDSQQVTHKSDMNLVSVWIKTKMELAEKAKTMSTLLRMHGIQDYSFVLQEMVRGQEIIIGMKRDRAFGPVIVFGLGGVFVEIIKDISMRIAPLLKRDCISMINEIKGRKLLEGYRNFKPVKKERLIELLMNISALAVQEDNIQEIDFNPVIVNEKDAIVVDARIIIKDA